MTNVLRSQNEKCGNRVSLIRKKQHTYVARTCSFVRYSSNIQHNPHLSTYAFSRLACCSICACDFDSASAARCSVADRLFFIVVILSSISAALAGLNDGFLCIRPVNWEWRRGVNEGVAVCVEKKEETRHQGTRLEPSNIVGKDGEITSYRRLRVLRFKVHG